MPTLTESGDTAMQESGSLKSRPRAARRLGPRRVAILFTLLMFLVVLMLTFSSDFIPSKSMEPTLKPGDHILTTRAWFSYPMNSMPARGDVITFRIPTAILDGTADMQPPPGQQDSEGDDGTAPKTNFFSFFKSHDKEEVLIKRVIGLPGDTVLIKHNLVYVNGNILKEDYKTIPPDNYSLATASYAVRTPFKVPPGELFLLGDNRQNSEDGRYWGSLKRRYVLGRFQRVLYNEGTAGPNVLRTQDEQ